MGAEAHREKQGEAGQTQSQREREEKEAVGLLLGAEKAWAQHTFPGCTIHSSYAPALPVFIRGAMIVLFCGHLCF